MKLYRLKSDPSVVMIRIGPTKFVILSSQPKNKMFTIGNAMDIKTDRVEVFECDIEVKENRPTGYYWVKISEGSVWEIAKYSATDKMFYLMFGEKYMEQYLHAVGDRIHNPYESKEKAIEEDEEEIPDEGSIAPGPFRMRK